MSDPCVSPWEYEKIVGKGWSYNEPGLGYDDAWFDTLPVYYNSLGLATVWAEDTDIADVTVDWSYEIANGSGWTYNMSGLGYDDEMFDDLTVYYNRLGNVTNWNYEQFIDGCLPTYYEFMDGDSFQFQNGTLIEFN